MWTIIDLLLLASLAIAVVVICVKAFRHENRERAKFAAMMRGDWPGLPKNLIGTPDDEQTGDIDIDVADCVGGPC